MMSEDDDFDYTSTKKSSGNLATLFRGGESGAPITPYVPPKQPKKDAGPRVMVASIIQAFSYGADQKWTPKGKMCVALLSTENTSFQMVVYVPKAQTTTSLRISTSSVLTPQSNNYLSFQDDNNQNWSMMFDTKQGLVDFALQLVLAKAYLSSFKFDQIVQDIREGEGTVLADNDSAEVTMNAYKLLENGTIQPNDPADNKPMKFKIGKNQNGKAFDDVLRGMKKGAQRVAIIGAALYSIEVTRIKREKEARSNSISSSVPPPPVEEPTPVETKRLVSEENESEKERNRMLQRISRMGGVAMIHHPHHPSAFAASNPHQFSDDDSITNEYIQNIATPRSISTPIPPVQFVQPGYHPPMHPQPLIQQPNMYPPSHQQQAMQDYMTRSGSAMPGMPYQQVSMWPQSQYPPPPTSNIPPTDMYYQTPPAPPPPPPVQGDFRQLLSRLNEKVDVLTEKFDAKNSTNYPNMETGILLTNIQRIIKENETVKKDLFDRSAKIEELNQKITGLLDRNQQLIEQSHQTVEQRNVVVNNVSEQTAQKILDLEKQKLELTTSLSTATSKIADLQLQLTNTNQGTNENQSRLTSLNQKCEQYRDDLQKSENQRLELQSKFDAIQEQYKTERSTRKQFQSQINALEEELSEQKAAYATLEKTANDRRIKYDNDRKRLQDELDEQKQTVEKELNDLRTKLRQQRSAENQNNNQEFDRIEKDLEKQWQDKFDRQQAHYEKLLSNKNKEFDAFQTSQEDNQTQLEEIKAELEHTKEELEQYRDGFHKIQQRLQAAKARIIEMNDEQSQLATDHVKKMAAIIFQRLKTRIQPDKQYTGEQYLTQSVDIIKKAALKVLSNDEDDDEEEEEDDQPSEDKKETNDQPTNGNSVDQQTLNEEVSSVQTQQSNSIESDVSSTMNSQKNGWDLVDDIHTEDNKPTEEQPTIVIQTTETENSYTADTDIETKDVVSSTPPPPPPTTEVEEHKSVDTTEENEQKPATSPEDPEKKPTSDNDDDDDDDMFTSARPSVQSNVAARAVFAKNIPANPDDSDDDMFK